MKLQNLHINIEGQKIPAKIYHELRRGSRASIGKKNVILRMPLHFNPEQQKECFQWFIGWLTKIFNEKQGIFQRFEIKTYQTGNILKVGTRTYVLTIEVEDRQSHQATLEKGVIKLRLAQHTTEPTLSKTIKQLLSKIVAKDFKPAITRRVLELNNQHFQKNIKSVKLKYNLSNWGSCSTRKNINLSTRLLFAPDSVIDYVIIHELAHLIEMNHSPRFWQLVETAMPNYKEKERWLKDHRHLCDF